MAFADFVKKLQDPESKEHAFALKYVKDRIEKSRSDMSGNYSRWDELDAAFRSERREDKEDRNAKAKGQPAKMVIPIVHSQVMTFVAFAMSVLTQNPRFFELEPTGKEDNPLSEPMELILERDTRRNTWASFLVQFLLDIGKFSLGAAEVCYMEEVRHIRVPSTVEAPGAFGVSESNTTVTLQEVPIFTGNKVYPVSPYHIFPDTNLPLTRYQDGEFMGSEEMWNLGRLRSVKLNLFNLDKIPKFTEDDFKNRKKNSRIDDVETRQNPGQGATSSSDEPSQYVQNGPVVLTKVCIEITPSEFTKSDKELTSLGDETVPLRYIVWYANDQRIVRFEEAYYLHGQFPYILAQFLPDQHRVVNESLADLCSQISSTITWFINAHITSVRSTIDGKFVVDPAGIEMKSLESRSPYIMLRPNASNTGVDQYIKQFQVNDVTAAFMQDASGLKDLLENITGYSAMMQGQHSEGRRSATQDRVVAQAGSIRGKATIAPIWDSAFEPLGKQLIANNRQEMEFETFARILGQGPFQINPETGIPFTLEELFALFKADPITIATSEDFFVFDGTLPSEKSFLAQSLQEILMQMLSNPQIAMSLGYGPEHFQQLFNDIYTLRGVTNSRMPSPKPQPLLQQGAVGPDGKPLPPESNIVPGPGAAAPPAIS